MFKKLDIQLTWIVTICLLLVFGVYMFLYKLTNLENCEQNCTEIYKYCSEFKARFGITPITKCDLQKVECEARCQ